MNRHSSAGFRFSDHISSLGDFDERTETFANYRSRNDEDFVPSPEQSDGSDDHASTASMELLDDDDLVGVGLDAIEFDDHDEL